MFPCLRPFRAPALSSRIVQMAALTVVATAVLSVNTKTADAAFLVGQEVTLDVANPTHTAFIATFNPVIVASSGTQVTSTNVPNIVNFVATISDESLTFAYPSPGASQFTTAPFNGYVLKEDSVSAPPFTYAAVDPSSTFVGLDNSRVTFDATHVYINVSALPITPGEQFTIDFSPAPEPATLSALALAGIPLLARRRT